MSKQGANTNPPPAGNILIMGDFFLQEVLLKVPPSPRHPEAGPTPYNHFSFQSGSVLFDFLTQLTLEHDWLHSGIARIEQYGAIRKNISDRIHGPCRLQGWSPAGPVEPATDEEKRKLEACRSAILSRARKEHITLEETSAGGTANARKALRIKDFQGHSAQATSSLSRPAVESPCLTIMSCDFQFFLEQGLDQCFTDYKPPETTCPVVCRIVLGPTVDMDEPSSIHPSQTKVEVISKNLACAVKEMSQGHSPHPPQPSVAVISSSTLKNFGFKISFRRSWERTVSDSLEAVASNKLKTLLEPFSYIVVSYFNEGALVINNARANGEHIFIFHPTSLEADLSLATDGATKGTETLITQAIASSYLLGKGLTLDTIASASLKGLKASRFLLLRGYSRLSFGEWNQVSEDLSIKSPPSDKVLAALGTKSGHADVVNYLWNRSRKNAFFSLQRQLVGTDVPEKKELATWPFGDLVEILCKGYVTFGSFPPTGVDDEGARVAVEKSTRDTAAAFFESGWLQKVVVPDTSRRARSSRTLAVLSTNGASDESGQDKPLANLTAEEF